MDMYETPKLWRWRAKTTECLARLRRLPVFYRQILSIHYEGNYMTPLATQTPFPLCRLLHLAAAVQQQDGVML